MRKTAQQNTRFVRVFATVLVSRQRQEIAGATAVDQDVTRVLGAAVADLQEQTGNLQREMDAFRIIQKGTQG